MYYQIEHFIMLVFILGFIKSKKTKIPISDENSKRKVLIKWQNLKPKHLKRIKYNCQVPDLLSSYMNSCIEPGFIAR